MTPEDEPALWARWRSLGDARSREALLALHMPYARTVAATYYARRLHDEIEFGDYLQFASVGLLEAMERYEPQRGAQFRTFAARRMHGAILDGIERCTERQQQIAARQRLRAQRMATAKAMAQGQADAQAMPEARLIDYLAEVGLGLALQWMLEGTGMLEDTQRAQVLPFYRHTAMRQVHERLAQALDALPAQERAVVRGHYLQQQPFEEIATRMGLTRGRISQVHRRALLRLREQLAAHADLDLVF